MRTFFRLPLLLHLDLHVGTAQQLDAACEQAHALFRADRLRQEIPPAVGLQMPGEEAALPAHAHGLLVEVVHELVDQRQGDELHLIRRQRQLAHQDVTAGIDAGLGLRGQHEGREESGGWR